MYKKNWATGFEEERPFNMAQLLMERLNKRFEDANEASIEGDYEKWYRVLRALKSSISFTLSDEENKEITNKLNVIRGNILNAIRQKKPEFYFEVEQSIDEVEERLVKLAFKYKIYYPQDERQSWEDELLEEDT